MKMCFHLLLITYMSLWGPLKNINCILDKSDNYLRNIKLIETTFDALSSGAVFSASRPSVSQIPFSKTTTSDQVEPSSEEYIDKSYTNDGYNFIVGIDFGTTFSGCSYVNLKDEKKTIKTIRDRWPGGNSLVFGKAPTLLMFDKKMKPAYWGEEARLMVNHNKDLHLLGNFKLALDSDHSYGSDSNKPDDNEGLRNQGGKTKNENNKLSAMNVISSYLKLFKNHVVEFIITNEMNENVSFFNRATLLKKYKFKYIITVPAMWDTAARETMAEAAIAATLIKRTELDQLLLISEPGAAALYCEKRFPDEFKHESSSENDDESNGKSIENFIVCDAGGGTVDLVTYKLEVKDGVSQISQIGDAVGDTCGSTTLDKNFKDYLLKFYSDVGITINSSTNINFDGVMRDFDRKHKVPYFLPNPNHGGHFNIDLPGQKETIHLSKDVNYRLTNDNTTLEMRNDDMKTKVFDPVVERVLELFKTQFDQAKKLDKKIDVILMVGGFSQSLYLQQRIKDNFRNECYIFVPEESTLAMSHGAVMYGLNPKTIIKEFAGRSFALEVQDRFEANDDVDKKVQGPDGQDYAKNRLQYFVKKGQGLKEHLRKKYTKEVYVEYPHDAVFAVYSSDTKDNTEGRYVTDKHTKIMETRVTLPPNVPGIQDRELILFKVTLETGHIEATVVIECQNALINDSVAHMSSNKKSSLKVEKKCNLNILKHKKHLIEYALVNSKVHK
ncbi:uncharacterized protein EV154DRAFT_76114 [Mucor mucedo]|uniref:uncharacterized protein n=1 Tax=Mucor mucedo TaxID=29922 RepID=UPI00221FD357|nr:uncharacterized protein EV154DRAFT_76114 [Mucor mucedo]KAI7875531.1 hypothetical protein EV154DRAFT_76114 [Mucor mucedo]